jgi:hypothetical protein
MTDNERFKAMDRRLNHLWRREHDHGTKPERWDIYTWPDEVTKLLRFTTPGGSDWYAQFDDVEGMTDEQLIEWIEVERAASLITGE